MLGPFWCQKENAWVRFTEAFNGTLTPEIAKKNPQFPHFTTDWEPAADNVWAVTYEEGYEDPIRYYYQINAGILYRTEGKINPYSQQLIVDTLQDRYWKSVTLNRLKEDAFIPFAVSLDAHDAKEILPYNQLPATPEKVAELEKLQQQKWEQYGLEIDRTKYFMISDSDSFFNKEQKIALHEEFAFLLTLGTTAIKPENFASCSDYIQALCDIIERKDNLHHVKIEELAANTYLDEAIGMETVNDNEMRQALLTQKRNFFYNLLKNEVAELCMQFNLPNPFSAPSNNNPPAHEENDYSIIIEEHEENNNSNIINEQYVPQVPYVEQPQPQQNVSPLLAQIKQRMQQAEANHAKWFNEQGLYCGLSWFFAGLRPSGTALRGANGTFTFLRHTSTGRDRVHQLYLAVQSAGDENTAIDAINNFIRARETNYHCHSGVSFILDELSQIAGSPWVGLTPGENNRYDRNLVLENLSQYAVAHMMEL